MEHPCDMGIAVYSNVCGVSNDSDEGGHIANSLSNDEAPGFSNDSIPCGHIVI